MNDFKTTIRKALSLALNEDEMDLILTQRAFKLYRIAFTSKTKDADANYEIFEQLGDVSIGKFIVNYMYKRFVQLNTSEGVDIVAKLKIKYASKEQLQSLGEQLNFWTIIMASEAERKTERKKLLEDVFEAFIGCTEYIIDDYASSSDRLNNYGGIGYNVVYRILKALFDRLNISLVYEKLVDAKSRLNELITFIKQNKNIKYKEVMIDGVHDVSIVWYKGPEEKILGHAKANLKKEAQEKAAAMAIESLGAEGLYKPPPDWFVKFNTTKLAASGLVPIVPLNK